MKKMVVAAVMATVSVAASAEGLYVGGAMGQAHTRIDCDACDKSDTGFKLMIGTRLSPIVAMEAAYVNFGKASVSGFAYGYPVDVDFKSHGLLVNGAFRYAATPEFSLVGRLGASILNTRVTGSVSGFSSVSEEKVALNPYLGIGAEFAVTKALRLTAAADFTSADIEFKGVSDSGGVQMLSVGLQYGY